MRNFGFNHLGNLKDIQDNLVEMQGPDEKVEDNDPTASLLKVIYQAGADGYPVGDLAYFVGNSANPEVKRFILENLMRDVSGMAMPGSMNLSDDELTVLTRRSGETMQQYASRLNSSLEKDRFIIDEAKRSIQNSKRAKDTVTE